MPRFSLIITTCDRQNLLEAAIRAALSIHFDDFEVIVSDNFSQPSAEPIVSRFDDPRIRFFRTESRLAMPDHWEFIWQQARGDYVIFVADDSALHPDLLTLASLAADNYDMDILSWRCSLYYHPDWDISYRHLPNRGNILGVDPGTSDSLYTIDETAVLSHFAKELRFSGCFPSVVNFLLRRESGEWIRRNAGRLHWAPCPDVSASVLALGTIRPGSYLFWDGFGAVGGRSKDSNIACCLSGGKESRRLYEFQQEFGEQDLFPHHPIKIESITNYLAAALSVGRETLPGYFERYPVLPETIARKTVDDMYVDRTVPWIDKPGLKQHFDALVDSLPKNEAEAVREYRDRCHATFQSESQAPPVPNPTPEEPGNWSAGGTQFVDMRVFGTHDMAGAAANLPAVLDSLNKPSTDFVDYYREQGLIGKRLDF